MPQKKINAILIFIFFFRVHLCLLEFFAKSHLISTKKLVFYETLVNNNDFKTII